MPDLGEDVQAQLDSLKPQESPISRALKNLMGAPGSDTAGYKPRPEFPDRPWLTSTLGGKPHEDHHDRTVTNIGAVPGKSHWAAWKAKHGTR